MHTVFSLDSNAVHTPFTNTPLCYIHVQYVYLWLGLVVVESERKSVFSDLIGWPRLNHSEVLLPVAQRLGVGRNVILVENFI